MERIIKFSGECPAKRFSDRNCCDVCNLTNNKCYGFAHSDCQAMPPTPPPSGTGEDNYCDKICTNRNTCGFANSKDCKLQAELTQLRAVGEAVEKICEHASDYRYGRYVNDHEQIVKILDEADYIKSLLKQAIKGGEGGR